MLQALERVGKLEAQCKVLQQERDKIIIALKNEVGEEGFTIEQVRFSNKIPQF